MDVMTSSSGTSLLGYPKCELFFGLIVQVHLNYSSCRLSTRRIAVAYAAKNLGDCVIIQSLRLVADQKMF